MDDELRVREGHCAHDVDEQPHAFGRRRRAIPAPGVDRFAVDVFEREVRAPVAGPAGVVHLRDVRMVERCEHSALARHPFGQAAIGPFGSRQLQGNLPFERSVGPLGQPDRAHAADAEFAQQPVGPDLVSGLFLGTRFGCRRDRLLQRACRQMSRRAAGFARFRARKQIRQYRCEVAVGVRQGFDPGGALIGFEFQRLRQQPVQPAPVGVRQLGA